MEASGCTIEPYTNSKPKMKGKHTRQPRQKENGSLGISLCSQLLKDEAGGSLKSRSSRLAGQRLFCLKKTNKDMFVSDSREQKGPVRRALLIWDSYFGHCS